MLALSLALSLSAAAPATVVVLSLEAGHGVEADLAGSASEAELVSVRRAAPGKVLGSADLKAMLGMEKQKELLGCKQDSSCVLEIGAALGANELVTGSLSRLGDTFLLVMRRVDPVHASVLKEGSRTRSTNEEAALIEDLGSLAYELYAPAPTPTTASANGPAPTSAANAPPAPSTAPPAPAVAPPVTPVSTPGPGKAQNSAPSQAPLTPSAPPSAPPPAMALPPALPGEPTDATLHRKACEAGSGVGCNKLGIVYGTGRGLPLNEPQAAALYRRACDLGEPHGCHNLGIALERGRGVPADPPQAANLFRRACRGGDPKGCFALERLQLER